MICWKISSNAPEGAQGRRPVGRSRGASAQLGEAIAQLLQRLGDCGCVALDAVQPSPQHAMLEPPGLGFVVTAGGALAGHEQSGKLVGDLSEGFVVGYFSDLLDDRFRVIARHNYLLVSPL